MSGFVRCTSGNAGPAWTCVLPAGHDHGHIYTRWSEIAAMAEAEIQRVREVCDRIWDDDLIDAVHEAIAAAVDDYTTVIHLADEDICAVIAAVEDWHLRHWQQSPLDVMGTLVEAEHSAAIQRVRELCDKPTMRTTDISGVTEWVRVRDIESALDGGAE